MSRVSILYSRSSILGLVLLIVLAGALFYVWLPSQPKQAETAMPIRSLAVLPFKPLSADGSDDYLGSGIADTLITKLSTLQQLIVRPTTSVLRYTARDQDPLAAGREQQVDAVMEGSIQRAGENVRVTVRLLNVADGKPLWAFQCNEQQCNNIFDLQDSISQQVSEALLLKLTGAERERLIKRDTENLEAYQFYLKGRYLLEKRTKAGTKKAREYFQQAIALDPNFALAYAGLAADIDGALSERMALVMKALELDETLAEAHLSLAEIRIEEWKWAEAEKEYKRAIELNPNYPQTHYLYAIHFLSAMGRHEEAIAEAKRAIKLDPLSVLANRLVAGVFLAARQYDQAIEQGRKALELDPYRTDAHLVLGQSYAMQGRYEDAIAELNKAIALGGRGLMIWGDLGYVYAVTGRRAEAMKMVEELTERSKKDPDALVQMAIVYGGVGDRDRAFQCLQKWCSTERIPPSYRWQKVYPGFDPLRSDPRFANVLRRMGLPQ